MTMRERRKAPRYPLGIAGKLHLARGSPSRRGVVRVISTLGCALECAESRSAGKRCELYFDWQGLLVGVEAQVVWKDAQGRMGLKFLSVDKDTQQRLSDLCASLRNQRLGAPTREEVGRARPSAVAAPARETMRPAGTPLAEQSLVSPPARPPEKREHRRVPRYVSELRTRLSHLPTGSNWNVILVSLSILGGCAEGSGLPQPGKHFELMTEWEGQDLRIDAELVWKGKDRVGFEFVPLNPEAERLLRQICANLRLQPLTPLPPEPL